MSDVWMAIEWTIRDYLSYVIVFMLGATLGAIGIILGIGPGERRRDR